jgi:hypothetical protein
MSAHIRRLVKLIEPLSDSQIRDKSTLRGERAWWVNRINEYGHSELHKYYVPVSCLAVPTEEELTRHNQQPLTITKQQKEQEHMIATIRILRKPSVKAQEAGETEEIIVQATDVVCYDTAAGIAFVAAENAEKILTLKSAELKVVATSVTS